MEQAGVDFVDLSGGTFEGRAFEHKKESTIKRESYFIEFAEMISPLLKKTKVYITGGFRTASGMAQALRDGACDGIGIGRPLGAEPYLCKDILDGKVSGVSRHAWFWSFWLMIGLYADVISRLSRTMSRFHKTHKRQEPNCIKSAMETS